MPVSVSRTSTISVGSLSFVQRAGDSGSSSIVVESSVPGAKSGTLTTRTDNDTGTLTMAASHGITTGQILDVFWSTGSRRAMTVGTVSGNSVPIDGGSGDNLPLVATAITAMVPVEETMVFDGDDIVAVAVKSEANGYAVFVSDAPADITTATLSELSAGEGKGWLLSSGDTNPLAGYNVEKVKFSHSSTSAKVMTAVVVQ